MVRRALPLVGIAAMLLVGCKQRLAHDDLVGTYRLNRPGAEDVLVLNGGGRYVHRFTPADGSTSADSSTWTLEEHDGEQRIVFSDFLMRAPKEDDTTRTQVRGFWAALVSPARSGDVRLLVNDDLGWYYVREAASR